MNAAPFLELRHVRRVYGGQGMFGLIHLVSCVLQQSAIQFQDLRIIVHEEDFASWRGLGLFGFHKCVG